MLGLNYKKREQWLKQLEALQKSRELNSESVKSGRSQFVISEAGLVAETAKARSRLGEHELAMELIQQSIEPLSKILEEDSRNGQAKRFLLNNVNSAVEINRRSGRFDTARIMLDKLLNLTGSELKDTLLPHAIEIEIADGNFELADEYIDRYQNESEKLKADQLKFDAIQFCWSIKTLEQSDKEQSDAKRLLRDHLVAIGAQNLSSWLKASDDYDASFDELAGHNDFAPLHEEASFLDLALEQDN